MFFSLCKRLKKSFLTSYLLVDFKVQPAYEAYFSYLKKLVHDLELFNYVKFDDVSEELLPSIFAASDAVVFPYTSSIGMTPIAHLTAAAYGKPIIATNIDSFAGEFSDHENALLIPPKDSNALANSIIEILTDDELSKKLSNNILIYCANRSVEKAVATITKIYKDALQCNK